MNEEELLARLQEIEKMFADGTIDLENAVALMIEKDRIDRHLAGK